MHLRSQTISIKLDLKTEVVDLSDLVLFARISEGSGEKISNASFTISDPDLKIANKLQQRALLEGGIIAPEELFPKGDEVENKADLASVQNGLAGDQLYSVIYGYCLSTDITDKAHIAYILASCKHESNGGLAITEIGDNAYFTRLYEGRSDLGNNQPGDGAKFKGRGYVQITGRKNYTEWGTRLGIDLVNSPDLAADAKNAIRILCQGMQLGTFTGRKLADYGNGVRYSYQKARAIVNGNDRAELIAGYAREFYAKLVREELKPNSAVSTDLTVRIEAKKALGVPPGGAKKGLSNLTFSLDQPITEASEKQLAAEIVPGYQCTVILGSNDPREQDSSYTYFFTGYATKGGNTSITLKGLAGQIHNVSQAEQINAIRNTSIYSLTTQVASEMGLFAVIPELTLASKLIPLVTQRKGESRYQVLVREARQQGLSVRVAQFEGTKDRLYVAPLYSDSASLPIKKEWLTDFPTFSDQAAADRITKAGLPPIVEGYIPTKATETSKKLAILGQQTSEIQQYEKLVADFNIGEGFPATLSLITNGELRSLKVEDVVTLPDTLYYEKSLFRNYRISDIAHLYPQGITQLNLYIPVWLEKKKEQTATEGTPLVKNLANFTANPGSGSGEFTLPGLTGRYSFDTPIISGGIVTWGLACKPERRQFLTAEIVQNLINISGRVQQFLQACYPGAAVEITSGFRDPGSNDSVGGASQSQHLSGKALDIYIAGQTPTQMKSKALAWGWLQYGGLGIYQGKDILHLDIGTPGREW